MAIFDTPACLEALKRLGDRFSMGRVLCWSNPRGPFPVFIGDAQHGIVRRPGDAQFRLTVPTLSRQKKRWAVEKPFVLTVQS
jgi:hypothetical protein